MSTWTQVSRLRACQKPDPYNPDRTVTDWSTPDELTLNGFLDSQSSADVGSAGRLETTTAALMYFEDPAADVKRGDRIRIGDLLWSVDGFPASPVSPFTGWQPWLVCNLKEVAG